MMKLSLLLLLLCGLKSSTALTETDYADCEVNPDPHFRTFHGTYYDFHATCDTVLIQSDFVNVHLRTELKAGWAGAINVAVGIGTDKLEMKADPEDVLLNDVSITADTTFAGFPFNFVTNGYSLNLGVGQFINVTKSYLKTFQIDVRAHGSNFGDAEAMCGNWTATNPDDLVGRDGTTVYDPATEGQDFGEDWQVEVGDPVLFSETGAENCTFNTPYCNGQECLWCEGGVTGQQQDNCCTVDDPLCQEDQGRRLLDPDTACAFLLPVTNPLYINCFFDVLTTGDEDLPNQVLAYTDPIPVPDQLPQCTAPTACADRGGRCVFSCQENGVWCLPDLCTATTGATEECSCEVTERCPNIFIWFLDLFLGWFFKWVLGIDLCAGGLLW